MSELSTIDCTSRDCIVCSIKPEVIEVLMEGE